MKETNELVKHSEQIRRERASHTPGPWHFGEPFQLLGGKNPLQLIGIGNGAEHIGYASITGCVPKSTAEANARLIAAAPELLVALKMAEGYLREAIECERARGYNGEANVEWIDTILTHARAALAKAKGQAT